MTSISSQVLALISEFEPLDLANTAWAYDTLRLLDGQLIDAIAAEALSKLESTETQPLATLVDVELPGCEGLQQRLIARIARFAEQWLLQDAFSGSNALLFDWQIDNFGIIGTGILLSKIGVQSPGEGFALRATNVIDAENSSRTEDWRRQRFFFKERVYCYIEFDLTHPTVSETSRLIGSLVKENSFLGEGTRAGRTGLLRSLVLPINELVDRTLCAEYQALSELCDRIDSVGVTGEPSRRFVTGQVRLWTSGASCLSCVSIIRQFLILFPKVSLEVFCAKRPG